MLCCALFWASRISVLAIMLEVRVKKEVKHKCFQSAYTQLRTRPWRGHPSAVHNLTTRVPVQSGTVLRTE